MGLISTEVEVVLGNRNVSYYERLGYDIPKIKTRHGMQTPRGTKIMIKVQDLSKGSNYHVKTYCDNCGRVKSMRYCIYNQNVHEDGRIYCQQCYAKLFNSGSKNCNYNPNKSDEERRVGRDYSEYTEFVKIVLKRDNYVCQCCGSKNNLQVHHLYGYAGFPEYRIDQSQAITLCDNCHISFHNWHTSRCGKSNKGNCTREQYEEWYGKKIENLQNNSCNPPATRQVYDIEENKVYKSAIDYSETHKVQKTIVYSCCNHKIRKQKTTNKKGETKTYYSKVNVVAGHHLLWYDEYLKMSNEDLDNYIQQTVSRNFVKVICVTTGKIFNSIVEAGCYYKINPDRITCFCRGKNKSAGILPDGTKLKWMYYNEFINLSQKEQDMILNKTT